MTASMVAKMVASTRRSFAKATTLRLTPSVQAGLAVPGLVVKG